MKAAVASRYGPPDVVTIADVPRPEPLDRIADAYRHVDAGHKKGTIVVTVS